MTSEGRKIQTILDKQWVETVGVFLGHAMLEARGWGFLAAWKGRAGERNCHPEPWTQMESWVQS